MNSIFQKLTVGGIALSLLLSACSKNIPNECVLENDAEVFSFNSVDRQYILYKPDSLPDNSPLVIMLHGRDQNAGDAALFGFNAIADSARFAVCYPQGMNCTWDNDKLGSKDVEFIKQLAAKLQADHKLSPNRTYLAGFSEGAALCNIIALEAGDAFTAIAVVSGEIPKSIWSVRNPQTPIPMLFMHGLNDRVFSINGNGYNGSALVDDHVKFWKDFNLCARDSFVQLNSNAAKRMYLDGVDEHEVWYYRLNNHEHVFPGDPMAPDSLSQSGINGAEEIWSFFRKW
jgi:polyhydroxybutyrate depolymerase